MSYADNTSTNNFLYKHAFVIKKNPQWRMRRSPAYKRRPKSDFRLRWTYPTKTSEGFIPNIYKISYTQV